MLDINEAAEYLGTSVRHMRHLVASRSLTHVKIGRKLRFRRSDLDAFIESNVVSAVAR